jgi:hypothetical protein
MGVGVDFEDGSERGTGAVEGVDAREISFDQGGGGGLAAGHTRGQVGDRRLFEIGARRGGSDPGARCRDAGDDG